MKLKKDGRTKPVTNANDGLRHAASETAVSEPSIAASDPAFAYAFTTFWSSPGASAGMAGDNS